MNTVGAATVFTGQDNSGEAAIVDSTQDTTFMENMLNRIANDEIAKKQKAERDREAMKARRKPIDYDPTGDKAFDESVLQKIDAAEQYATDMYAQGLDPSDPYTEAGKTYQDLVRGIKTYTAQGRANAAYAKGVEEAGDNEGVDVGVINEWISGYQKVQPQEGESLEDARTRYIDENPKPVKKAFGQYEFVKPLLPHVKAHDTWGGGSAVRRKDVELSVNSQLTTPQGQQAAEAMGLDFTDEKAVEQFKKDQVDLIMREFPPDLPTRTTTTKTTEKGGGEFVFGTTHSDDPNMYDNTNPSTPNAIKINTKTGGQLPMRVIDKKNGEIVDGIPNAIVKNKNGDLFIEYFEVKKSGYQYIPDEKKKQYRPYDEFRNEIINLYGRDIALDLDEGASGGVSTGNGAPSGGTSR